MSRKIYLASRAEEGAADVDPYDCLHHGDADWEEDANGEDGLAEAPFYSCWFQLADIHTDSVNGGEYAHWVRSTIESITDRDPDGNITWTSDAHLLDGIRISSGTQKRTWSKRLAKWADAYAHEDESLHKYVQKSGSRRGSVNVLDRSLPTRRRSLTVEPLIRTSVPSSRRRSLTLDPTNHASIKKAEAEWRASSECQKGAKGLAGGANATGDIVRDRRRSSSGTIKCHTSMPANTPSGPTLGERRLKELSVEAGDSVVGPTLSSFSKADGKADNKTPRSKGPWMASPPAPTRGMRGQEHGAQQGDQDEGGSKDTLTYSKRTPPLTAHRGAHDSTAASLDSRHPLESPPPTIVPIMTPTKPLTPTESAGVDSTLAPSRDVSPAGSHTCRRPSFASLEDESDNTSNGSSPMGHRRGHDDVYAPTETSGRDRPFDNGNAESSYATAMTALLPVLVPFTSTTSASTTSDNFLARPSGLLKGAHGVNCFASPHAAGRYQLKQMSPPANSCSSAKHLPPLQSPHGRSTNPLSPRHAAPSHGHGLAVELSGLEAVNALRAFGKPRRNGHGNGAPPPAHSFKRQPIDTVAPLFLLTHGRHSYHSRTY
jgi:hypothetical protein